jgi:hypothetical protein
MFGRNTVSKRCRSAKLRAAAISAVVSGAFDRMETVPQLRMTAICRPGRRTPMDSMAAVTVDTMRFEAGRGIITG